MHIVLLILKILGIILLCVLGLVLLILAALLFSAFRYEVAAEGDKDGPELHVNAKVRWLLRIVSFQYLMNTGGKNGFILRVFGIPVLRRLTDAKTSEDEKADEASEKTEEKSEKDAEEKTEEASEGKPKDEAGEKPASDEVPEENAKPEGEQAENTSEEDSEGNGEAEPEGDTEIDADAEASDEEEKPKGIKGKLAAIKQKIRDKYDGLKKKVHDLWDSAVAMFELFRRKEGLLEEYVKKKSTLKAVKTAWVNLLWVLKHIAPKKYHGGLTFGLDDPALTGEIFGAAAPLYLYVSDYLRLEPAFENRLVVSGDIYLKGRIRLWGILLRALRLYRDKNIRKVIREANKVKETIMETPKEAKELLGKAA